MQHESITVKPKRDAVRRPAAIAVALLAGTAGAIVIGIEPAAAAPPTPRFGPAIDPYLFDGSPGCDPTEKPGVADFRGIVLAAYPGTTDNGIVRACGGSASQHNEGRAWDWGVSSRGAQRALADDLLNWLLATDQYGNAHALARRFGIMQIIFDSRIWESSHPNDGWTQFFCNPSRTDIDDCHVGHVHFTFSWAGAREQTTWWTGKLPPPGKVSIGFYSRSDGSFSLRNANSAGPADGVFGFGPPNMVPVAGDWNADGKTTVGWYDPSNGVWHLRNSNTPGGDDASFQFGGPGWIPVTGDWNGDGKTTVGVYNPVDGTWKLRNSNTAGGADGVFQYGGNGWLPVTGDWNNDGKTTVGVYNPGDGTWKLRNSNTAGNADVAFQYGGSGLLPVTGDWNNDGKTTVGVYNPADGTWKLRNSNTAGGADAAFGFGPPGMVPITGDWDSN